MIKKGAVAEYRGTTSATNNDARRLIENVAETVGGHGMLKTSAKH